MSEDEDTEPLNMSGKYANVLRSMQGELTYTDIPDYIRNDINKTCQPRRWVRPIDCAADPTFFTYHVLGIRPYAYQYMLFDKIRDGKKRIIMISSRQIGKSLAVAMLALWMSYYNTMPSGIHSNTKVIIVSKSEGQAKKIIKEIRDLIYLGDRKFAVRTRGKVMNVMSDELDIEKAQTVTQISWKNGCFIKSLSPTDSAKGETADIVFMDECGFIPEELYYEVFEPMTSAVKGIMVLTSTPNGCSGLAFTFMDPYNERESNPYDRLWIPWWYCENEGQKAEIEVKKEQWIAEGKLKSFQQEYEARFTVSETSFFDADKVDNAVDKSLAHVYEWHTEPCSLGLDYGWKSSRTAITIVSKSHDGIVRERFHHAYPTDGSDVDILKDILALNLRFNLKYVIPDDCSMGYLTNQKLINAGLPVQLFNFRTDQTAAERNKGYYMLRAAINKGTVKLTDNKELVKEMKMLLEIKKQMFVSLKAPEGENDDRADSLAMACYPFLFEDEDDDDLAVMAEYKAPETELDRKLKNPRYDKDWANLSGVVTERFADEV